MLAAVIRPLARDASSEGVDLARRVGRRFKSLAWVSLVLLIVTGFFNVLNEGGSARIESAWGGVLMLKLFLVLVMIGLSVVHDFILDPYGPSAGRGPAAGTARRETAAARVQVAIVLVAIVILLIAAYLARM
ncbi:MAG: CopD family protein [Nitrospirota bacterium]